MTSPVQDSSTPAAVSATPAAPLVSIVMPTFNRAHLVGQAIDAVMAQTYSNWELILVNDGSRDNTRAVIDGYAACDPRIRCIHKDNEGIPDTVNRGWREAKGEYLTWTSDDNLYFPAAIERMLRFLETHADIAFVFTDSEYIDGEGRSMGVREAGPPEMLEDYCPLAGCLLFRRAVLATVDPFRRQWRRCHDFDFYHRVYQHFKLARIPEVLYYYRCHAASMSGNQQALVTDHYRCLCSYPENAGRKRHLWARAWKELAKWEEKHGPCWRAVPYHVRAALYEPQHWPAAWGCLWKTVYIRLVPPSLKALWRRLRGRS